MNKVAGLAFLSVVSIHAQDVRALWKFAVSGDSRNCGDLVMPAIAAGVKASGAEFYWHLGDFRAMYAFDEDLVPPEELHIKSAPLNINQYLTGAWPDFIHRQLDPFGDMPVYLAIGNHEVIPPATRDAWVIQFADWLEQPQLRAQRLKDDATDRKLHTYNHRVDRGIDFITLDNASSDQFDAAQLAWITKVLAADEASPEITTIVAGMHEALPGSVAHRHSMSDSPLGNQTGRAVYDALWHAKDKAHKQIYLLASHSHFYMDNIFRTSDWAGKELPGWIIGSAGAVRYKLPPEAKPDNHAATNVYGYLVATAMSDGSIRFEFQKLSEEDLVTASPTQNRKLIGWCFAENHQ